MQLTKTNCSAMLCAVIMNFAVHSFLTPSTRASINGHRDLQSNKSLDRERDKTYARQQFNKNFSELQVTAQKLLKEHELGNLTVSRLTTGTKAINKCAKTLRALIALGDLAIPLKIKKELETPEDFDKSLRSLAKHVWDFAHNPIHQNSKVFNTDQAEQAQTDLLAIIDISKAIENNAKKYAAFIGSAKQ